MKITPKSFIASVVAIGILSFSAGYIGANPDKFLPSVTVSDTDWAKKQGLFSVIADKNLPLKQGEFMKILLTEYKPDRNGVIVPHGAENHWAAQYYATAQSEGLIGCSCQIKPDENISFLEASKFVYQAINKKAGKDLVTLEGVQAWVKHTGEPTVPATYGEVATLMRKMDSVLKEQPKKEGI